MSFGRLIGKIEYKDGYVKKSDIFKALETVEKEEDCEYGDYGSVLSKSYTCEYGEVWDAIDSVETEKVKPVVHAKWVTWEEANNDIPSPNRHECSNCHDSAQVLINGMELLSDWCSNCGARMDNECRLFIR